MPWFNVDDSAHSHPKIVKAGNAAFGLWTRCGSYVAQHLTDGIVPGAIADMYGTAPQITKLVAAGLWHRAGHTCAACPQPTGSDFYMHDYGKNGNPLRADVLAKRARAAEKKRRQREGTTPPPPNPGPKTSRFETETNPIRGRFDDESSSNHTSLFDDYAGHDDLSRGDSLGTSRARAVHSTPLHSKEDMADERERTDRSSRPAPQPPLSLITSDWKPSSSDRLAAAADLARLGAAAHAATAKFVRHHQTRGTRAADFGPAWVTWMARERPDTQGAFLVPVPGRGTPTTAPTPTPPSLRERMAQLEAELARDTGETG